MSNTLKDLFTSQQFTSSPMSPIELFNIIGGSIYSSSKNPGIFDIELIVDEFIWGGETVNSSMALDGIDCNGRLFEELSGIDNVYRFPINPEEGYIEVKRANVILEHFKR